MNPQLQTVVTKRKQAAKKSYDQDSAVAIVRQNRLSSASSNVLTDLVNPVGVGLPRGSIIFSSEILFGPGFLDSLTYSLTLC